MNQPVPVSLNAGGFTVVGPLPQSSVTSDATSAITSTTAGLARRRPSVSEMLVSARAGLRRAESRRSVTATAGGIRGIIRVIAITYTIKIGAARVIHEPPDRGHSHTHLRRGLGHLPGGGRGQGRGLPRARREGRDPQADRRRTADPERAQERRAAR